MKKRAVISQREAIRLRKRVKELEQAEADRFNAYDQDYPGGVNIAQENLVPENVSAIEAALKLGAMVVVKMNGGTAMFYGINQRKK